MDSNSDKIRCIIDNKPLSKEGYKYQIIPLVGNKRTLYANVDTLASISIKKELPDLLGQSYLLKQNVEYILSYIQKWKQENFYVEKGAEIENLRYELYNHYILLRKMKISWKTYIKDYKNNSILLIMYTDPKMFENHLRNYDYAEPVFEKGKLPDVAYEMKMAIIELLNAPIGAWLIRNSSLNRATDMGNEEERRKIVTNFQNYSIHIYAISFKNIWENIYHCRFAHYPGMGWCIVSGVNGTVTPPVIIGKYHNSFLECLETILSKFGLIFENKLSGYAYSELQETQKNNS